MNMNPVVSEIISGALRALEEEVEDLLARTWRSPTLRDTQDFSVSLYDRFGRVLTGRVFGAGPGPILETVGPTALAPGDVFVHNDPYLPPTGLGEVAEVCLTQPLFDEDYLIAFLQVRARHDDLGGILPGGGTAGASESFHEGLLIPPVRIIHRGNRVEDIQTLLLRNSRFPETLRDDFNAQIGALKVGSVRIQELINHYGSEQLTACFADLLRECEIAFKKDLLPKIPESISQVETLVETDGFAGPHYLSVTLFREGEHLVVDLNGAGPQTEGPINCPLDGEGKTSLARLISPLLLHLAGDSARMNGILVNDGACRVIDIRLPGPGTLLTPHFPAPTGLRALTISRLISAFSEALFLAVGGNFPAGFENLRHFSLWGNSGGDTPFLFRESLGAGTGATPHLDGVSAVSPIGGNSGMPIEVVEARYPIRIESAGLVLDSGGTGKYRGGSGAFREYRMMADGTASSAAGAGKSGPFGGNGGGNGSPFRITLAGNSGKPRNIPPVSAAQEFKPGDLIRIETPGGGGWGAPVERDPAVVRRDVLRGLVSRKSAKNVYAVALGHAPDYPLNKQETTKLRREKSRQKKV